MSIGNAKILHFLILILTVYALPIFSQNINESHLFKANGIVRGIAIDHEKDSIYFGACDHYLYCIDLSGKLKWKYNTGSAVHRVAYDKDKEQIYCRSKSYNASATHLCCVSAEGDLMWEYHTGNFHGIDVDPYTNDIYLLIRPSKRIFRFSSDGHLKWDKQLSTGLGLAIDPEQKVIYYSSDDGFLYSLNCQGNTNWKIALHFTDDIAVNPSTGYIYCASWNGYVYCFDSDGSCIWMYNTGNVNSGITVDTVRGKVYCAVKDHGICCFSLEGWLLCKYKIKNIETWASIQVDSQTGDVYFGSTDGWLYHLSPPDHHQNANELEQDTVIQDLEERIKALENIIGPPLSP